MQHGIESTRYLNCYMNIFLDTNCREFNEVCSMFHTYSVEVYMGLNWLSAIYLDLMPNPFNTYILNIYDF